MKFYKIIAWIWIVAMLASASFTFYLGIKTFTNNPVIEDDYVSNINKIKFDETEWKSFINSDGTIDQKIFTNTFLRKLSSQQEVSSIKFEFENQKAVVSISDQSKQYKWFYELV